MLLLSFITAAIAGGPGKWNASVDAVDPVTPPITVHVVEGINGYTRLEITNNARHELGITLQLSAESGFRFQRQQWEALCEPLGPAPGPEVTEATQCGFIFMGGMPQDVLITHTPKGPGDDELGKVTIIADTPEGTWIYTMEKPLIGKNSPAE